MTVYELTTNEGTYLVRIQPTRQEMYAYIRAKRALGYSLASVLYCWGPRGVMHKAPTCPAK